LMAVDDSTSGDTAGVAGYVANKSWFLAIVAPDDAGSFALLDGLTIGRGDACQVRVAASATSREHARIERDGPLWIVRDLGSRNGVFVDGRRVDAAALQPGTVIRAGGCLGIVINVAEDLDGVQTFGEIVDGLWGGESLRLVARRAQLAAKSRLNIVLEAESGSGKECFARAVHDWSGRSGAFVAINCSALPASLAEAELFGFQRGAFTGAERNQTGYFRAAHTGTLFLDELLELPHPVQAKLLRAVERREVVPLGATQPIQTDARIISASQVPLSTAVASGQLRADLLARLNGVTVRIPPLRERREDIWPLFRHFVAKSGRARMPSLGVNTLERLCLHDWSLNVRELEAVANRLAALHPDDEAINPQQLDALIGTSSRTSEPLVPPTSSDAEWTGFVEALSVKKGNVVRAAESIGISRQRAYRLIANHPEFDVASLRRAH
jgi:sigma-54 dependent transcriptional regulator, acetoin dehydrogenase operon transcriptional activator AcoR